MEFGQLKDRLKGIPHTTPEKGKILYGLIEQTKPERCLELGFACGVGSAYIAGALEQIGENGNLIAVDNLNALDRHPKATDLLSTFNFASRVEFIYHELGYLWFLMDALERNLRFDFVFLDGAHTWDVDGFAFCLVDRLLAPAGIIVFDDLDWTYASSPTMRTVKVPEQMRQTPGVRKIFELLVKPHPLYSIISENAAGMAIVKKNSASSF
jgi:predicted O-methyltransferase YrrM